MDCKNIEDILIFYALNEISGAEKEEVQKHLNKCETCNSIYNNLKADLNIIDEEKVTVINENFTANIMSEIENISSEKMKKNNIIKMFQPLAAAAGIILILTIGILTGNMIAADSTQNITNTENEIYYFNDLQQENAEFFLLNE